jgi:glycosyltransferase involved in cell wall biosynthesis
MSSRRKRIVQIGPAYPLRGGNTVYASYLFEELSKDHDVLTISYSRLYPGILFPGTRQHDVSGVPLMPHATERIIDSMNPLTWGAAARRAAAFEPDLVFFNWWQPFFGAVHRAIARGIARRSKAPKLFICENLVSHEARTIDVVLTRMALSQADAFMALCKPVQAEIEKMFPGKPTFLSAHPVYDCYPADPALTPQAARAKLGIKTSRVVLFFGFIRKYKGIDLLLKAFAQVRKDLGDVHLLVVGEPYESIDPYTELIRSLGLNDAVTMVTSYVPNEEVSLYFTASDMLCLPYHSATVSGPLTIAQALRKPVIVTDVGGLSEYVDHGRTGFVVPPEDPAALAAQIVAFYRDYGSVDFASNIAEYVRTNRFYDIRGSFAHIMKVLGIQ